MNWNRTLFLLSFMSFHCCPKRLAQLEIGKHPKDEKTRSIASRRWNSLLVIHIIASIVSSTSPSPSSILDYNDYASPVAEIPIQILLSNGGSMGVAFLRHSTIVAWSSNDAPTFSKSQVRTSLSNCHTWVHQSTSSHKLRLIQFRTKILSGQSLSSKHLSGQPAGMDQRWVNHSD